MKFNDFSKVKPDKNVPLLVKFKNTKGLKYYVMNYIDYCPYGSNETVTVFEEADGEQYYQAEVEDVLGWMYLSDLDIIKVE